MRPSLPLALVSLLTLILPRASADPASIPFSDCFDEPDSVDQKLDVNTVYAQVLQNGEWGRYLNLTVLGTSRQGILGMSNASTSLSTLFTTTSVLTLNAWTNSSYLCENMRPPSPLPAITSTDDTYCPVAQGPFAFSSTIPWGRDRELTTLITQLRAVDPFGKELLCIDMFTTPLSPRQHSPYGRARIIFWSTVALAMSYWLVVGSARISSAWGRGISRQERGLWSRVQSAGFILASAISGERLAASPALMRFCTPSLRDVIFHTQWCSVLAMVAVEWPQFAYPLLTQTAWSTLTYNISLTHGSSLNHWSPFNTTYSPPNGFADQFADPTSPIFIDRTLSNVLFTLPPDAKQGISSFAYTIGLRPQDLFPTFMILFLGIIAATIVISVIVWAIDYTIGISTNSNSAQAYGSNMNRLGVRAKSPGAGHTKDLPESLPFDESKLLPGSSPTPFGSGRSQSKFALPLANGGASSERGINSHRSWWRLRSDIGTFHGSVLHGNLVRILVLFHLPVTVFSCYQMTMSRSVIDLTSIVLAALSFIVFSILIPAHLVIRVTFTTTNKLYDETKTLLALGPLYNHYRHGSQLFASLFFATNIAFGVTVGAGQKSGTAQAIIILVVEVASALVTSIWLPWGSGASMGLISFLFCVARIVIAVLLVILTQAISIGPGPGGWVAYGILVILALVYFALVLMLIIKVIEALVRVFGGIGFERSRHTIDSGLIGVCGLLGCCGTRKRRRSRRSRRKSARNGDPAQDRDSDLSSYMPPSGGIMMTDGAATPPRFLNAESRKNSTYSQPPSVLKPEQAFKPYVEPDNEDEGYIMGAWQPFPRPNTGYTSVGGDPPQSPTAVAKPSTPATSSTGFSRVGGGRAHIDTPYAITAGSTHAFPSIGQQSTRTQQQQQHIQNQNQNPSSLALIGQPSFYGYGVNDSHDEPLSVSSVEMGKASTGVALGTNGLPAGAMMPAHTRTKSQTAIVEDYMPTAASSSSVIRQAQQQPSQAMLDNQLPPRQVHVSEDTYLRPPDVVQASKFTLGPDDDNDSDDERDTQRKKKPWYHLRRNRPHSTEGRSSAAASNTDLSPKPASKVDEELGGAGSSVAQTQRSFVVIRKPQGSMGRLNQDAGPSQDSSTTSGAGTVGYTQSSERPPTR